MEEVHKTVAFRCHTIVRTLQNSITPILVMAGNESILQQQINRVMNELQFWFHLSSLMLNTEKTITVFFCTWQKKMSLKQQIKFDSMDVAYKSETKFMGVCVCVNENVNWDVPS
jgi:hypothetical protein